MKRTRIVLALAVVAIVSVGTVANAEMIATPITSFNPNTYFSGGVTAGIDFDDDSNGSIAGNQLVTQSGFVSIAPSNNKIYNVTTGGITFDVDVRNANLGNQNRWRGNAFAGDLINDFEQWYGRYDTAAGGDGVEASVVLTGLVVDTDYDVTFFTCNLGAGNTTHSFYEGTSSAGTLITTFTTAGGPNTATVTTNYDTWRPGVIIRANSGATGTIAITVEASEFAASTNTESRLTLDGIAVNVVPEPATLGLLAIGGLALLRRRRRA